MSELMKYKGRTVVAPILARGRKLTHPLEDYFPDHDPNKWFSWSIEEQNRWVKEQFDNHCVVFGTPRDGERIETHHLIPLGMGSKESSRVPWAMIPVMKSLNSRRSLHDLLHGGGLRWSVVHWDPLDEENGLEVIDEMGRRIPHDEIWFYHRPTKSQREAAIAWAEGMNKANRMIVEGLYLMSSLAGIGKEYAEMLGSSSLASWASENGMDVQLVRLGARLWKRGGDWLDELREKLIPPRYADLYFRRVPKEERGNFISELVSHCSPLSPAPSGADFITWLNENFPPSHRRQKVTVIKGEAELEPLEVEDIAEVIGEGKVIRGWPISGDNSGD